MEPASVTPREYFGVLRRHKWIMIGTTVVLMLAAYLYARSQSPLYQASVSVAVNQQPPLPGVAGAAGNNSGSQQRFASTEAQLARSVGAARYSLSPKAPQTVSDERAQAFLNQSDASADPASNVITFSVQSADPDRASRLASAYANGFAAYSAAINLKAPQARRTELRKEVKVLDRQIAQQNSQQNGKHTAGLYGRAALAAKDLQDINTFIAFVKSNAVVITTASQGATKVQPRPVRDVTIAAVVGLILGAVGAFIFEAFSGRVGSVTEIAGALKLPVLAQLPRPSRRLDRDDRLVLLHEPDSPEGEPYRILAARLALLNAGNRRRILVTSATGDEGKSTTIANLAVAFAQAGSRVALVDLDINKPGLFRFFDASPSPGSAEVARGEDELHSSLQRVNVSAAAGQVEGVRRTAEPLLFLPLGNLTDDPVRFLGSPELNQILSSLADTCDVVFIDTAPMLLVSYATVLASRVDALLTVARNDALTRPLLKRLEDALDGLPVYKAGVILTNAESTLDYRYGTPPMTGGPGAAATRI